MNTKVEQFKAKSGSDETLIEHSQKVADLTKYCSDYTTRDDYKTFEMREKLKWSGYLAGLLHDIGKCQKDFQSVLSGKLKSENYKGYRHQEVGWAFLKKYFTLKGTSYDGLADEKIITYAVYWHHGIPIDRKLGKRSFDDILDQQKDGDIEMMKSFVRTVLGNEFLNEGDEEGYDYDKTPSFFHNKKNTDMEFSFIRGFLVSADRHVSEVVNPSFRLFFDKLKRDNVITPIKEAPESFNKERFQEQLRVAAECDRTTIAKGTAGWGKTILALMYIINHTQEKALWVVPRNFVGHSVFDRIIKDLKSLGKENEVSVELFLTGEVQRYYEKGDIFEKEQLGEDHPSFNADIIVVNIDNFLAPVVGNTHADKLFFIYNTTVIFDEFHELLSDQALFYCFVNIMRIRNLMTDSNTLLISATPNVIHKLWDDESDKNKITTLNPSEGHLKPIPDRKFKPVFIDGDLPQEYIEDKNCLTIYNSVSKAQEVYLKSNNYQELIHSYFEDGVVEKKFYDLINEHDDKNKDKRNVMGTPILQASLDVSYKIVAESILSPDSSLQRNAGRANRHDEYEYAIILFFYNTSDKSEGATIKNLYDLKKDGGGLMNKWKNFLRDELEFKEFIYESDLYRIYNDFYKKYSTETDNYVKRKLRKSGELSEENIYPIDVPKKKKENEGTYTANSNPLRSNGDELFITTVRSDTKELINPISFKLYDSREEQFDEDSKGYKVDDRKLTEEMKKHKDDHRFAYKNILGKHKEKKMTKEKIARYAQRSNTPYIRFDVDYTDELGLIKKKILDKA